MCQTLRGDPGEHPCPPPGQTMLERTRLSEETLVSPGSASVGFCQVCPCRPGVFGHAAPGLKQGSAASTCSSLFLNNGFCCSVMLVDSKRAAVTAVSAQQILTLVEASHRPDQHWGASLLLSRRRPQHTVFGLLNGAGVHVCVGVGSPPGKGSPFSDTPLS